MKILLILFCLLLACAPRPPRPLAANPDQARKLEQCDYVYSKCLGRPNSTPPSDMQPNPMDWHGELPAHCNKRLKSCYDRAIGR